MRRILAVAAAGLLASACKSPGRPIIGIVLDGDGERGAQLAADDINAAGGIRGQALELRFLRGQSSTTAKVALAAAESLATDPAIVAVVGHTNSSASLAAAQIYNTRGVVQIAPTSTAPLYSEMGPYSFRLLPPDSHQGAYLASLILAERPVPSFALLYVNDDYGRALQSILVHDLALRDVAPSYQAPFSEGEHFRNVADVARAIAEARPRLLVWIGRSPELIRLLPDVRARLPQIRVLASDGLSGAYNDTARALDGVRYVRFLDLSNPAPAVAGLRHRYEQRWHLDFSDQYLLAYEAVRLLAEAIRTVGTDRDAIRDYLSSLGHSRAPYPGLAGPLAFDAHGDPQRSYVLAEVMARRSHPVSPATAGPTPRAP